MDTADNPRSKVEAAHNTVLQVMCVSRIESGQRSQSKSSLAPPRQRLVELMQRLGYGRIEDLEVRGGEPAFEPAPRVIQEIKIGGENGPRPELARDDFALKSQVTEFFGHLGRLGQGVVKVIEVKHGLPFRLVIEDCQS